MWSRSKFWTASISLRWILIFSSPEGVSMWCQSILHVFACVGYDKCHRKVRVHVPVLIPPFRCHQGLFLAYYCTVMSQRRKSAITFPYIILMSSHSNTDPSQPILTHEIWQAAPEVVKLLLGNRITVHLGFRGESSSQAANSLIWAGIEKLSLCMCFPLTVCDTSTTVSMGMFCHLAFGDSHHPCGSHGQAVF